jgi:2-amino-4-hydroxy-6-hydroxymethyldihydropteridine diphosphokinase
MSAPAASTFAIALGSNLGDRLANLREGARLVLERVPGARLTAAGGLYETAPMDCPPESQPFYNSALLIEAAVDARALHRVLLSIEHDLGRPEQRERHAPRTLDLDILHAGEQVLNDADLIIPHPRAHQRRFVLQPLADCDADRVLPGCTENVSALLSRLPMENDAIRLVLLRWLEDADTTS